MFKTSKKWGEKTFLFTCLNLAKNLFLEIFYIMQKIRELLKYRAFPLQHGINDLIPSLPACLSLLKYVYCGDTEMPPEHSLYLFAAPQFFGFTNARLQVGTIGQVELPIFGASFFSAEGFFLYWISVHV